MPTPSPIVDREGWRFAIVGDYMLPAPGLGRAWVTCDSMVKTDSKTKKGKNSATVTTTGKEQSKVQIKLQFFAAEWEAKQGAIEANLDAIDPNGPNGGGPFPFSYPGLGPGAPKYIKITKVSRPPTWNGTLGEVTVDALETDLAIKGSGSATKTDGWVSIKGSEPLVFTPGEAHYGSFDRVVEAAREIEARIAAEKAGKAYDTGVNAPNAKP